MISTLPFQRQYLTCLGLSLMSLVTLSILGLIFPDGFRELEEKSLDYRFRLRQAVPEYAQITQIGIDDQSLDSVGVWPWDRSIHARMLALLHEFHTDVVALDIIFPRPSSPEGDAQFIHEVRQGGHTILSAPFQLIDRPCFSPEEYTDFLDEFPHLPAVLQPIKHVTAEGAICIDIDDIPEKDLDVLEEQEFLELVMRAPFVYTGDDDRQRVQAMLKKFPYPFQIPSTETLWYANRVVAPMTELTGAAGGLGHISATPDSDGVFRRVPLVIRVQDQLFPSLAFAAALTYLQVSPHTVEITPGKEILLPDAIFPGKPDQPTDIRIPVDERLRLRVNFPLTQYALSFSDVLEAENDPALKETLRAKFEGTVCTIGYISTGTGDIGPTPTTTNYSLAFIHAAILNTILTQNFFYETGWGMDLVITLVMTLMVALSFPRFSPLRFTLFVALMIAGYLVVTLTLFSWYGIILKVLYPTMTVIFLTYASIIIYWYATEERERKHLRSAFRTYVSRQMLGKILENRESLALTGQRKELTIMFSDVRKFSTLSDKISPEVIHRLLNMYFSRMTEIAFKYDGFVDKFIGDGLLCFFGDPLYHPDHAMRAVQTAIEMQKAVREIGPEIQAELGLDPIVIRIGINTGYVIVGNMGCAERMEYTVLGSDVNLAQRLESSATPGQIMISQHTYELVQEHVDVRDMGDIRVKGFERPVKVYEIELPFE